MTMRVAAARGPAVLLVTILAVTACQAAGSPPTGPRTAPPSSGLQTVPSTPAPDGTTSGVGPALSSDPLHDVELFDVRTSTTFTLGEMAAGGPVLLETMAIWCTNCRAQQHEVVAAHELVDFESVSLDVDPNERPADLADYAASMGFDWRFAMANQALAAALRDRFGVAVLNPPSTPMILLFPDGSVRALEFRGHSAEELAAEIAAG